MKLPEQRPPEPQPEPREVNDPNRGLLGVKLPEQPKAPKATGGGAGLLAFLVVVIVGISSGLAGSSAGVAW